MDLLVLGWWWWWNQTIQWLENGMYLSVKIPTDKDFVDNKN
jgi:hypothetical protein